MSPEVLPPPSELQSDARKNTVGPHVKTPATQPGVNTPLSHSEENESKLACSTLAGDSAEQMHVSQPLAKQTIKTRSPRDTERSGVSSDDYDNTEVIRWDSTRECFLHNDRRLETEATPQRDRKRRTHTERMLGCLAKVNNSYRRFCGGNDAQSVDTGNKDEFLGTQSDIKYSVLPFKDLCGNTALDSESRIYSSARGGSNEENDPEDENCAGPKVEQLKAEQLEQDSLFFSCTICNDNFKEKRHFHRHMMYHLGKHNQVQRVSQPFRCAECGLLFCDSSSLMRHIIIHHERLEELRTPDHGGRAAAAPPPPRSCCTFGWNGPKIRFQDTETHENLKHCYFCEECNYIASTQRALVAHLHVAHLDTHQPQHRSMSHTDDAGGAHPVQCEMGFFTSRDQVEVQKHSGIYKYTKMTELPRMTSFKPNMCEDKILTCSSSQNGDLYIPKTTDKPALSLRLKARASCTESTLSPHLWRLDKHGKLLLQPAETLHVETDLTCVEEDAENNDRKAFGSLELANCPAAAAFTARKLKLDQMFCQGSKNDLVNGSLRVQVSQNSPSMRKMTIPLHNTTERMNGNILPGLSQRLKKQCAVRELKKGCEGDDNFSDDTSEATGGFLESSENERKSYARRYLRKRKSFTAKQNPHTLKVEDDGDEDCSDTEQLIIKEEHTETTVSDESTELLNTSPSDSFDISPPPSGNRKPCPYCAAMFESGVGLSNHVRGHLHRAGVSYDARHTVSPEQVALWDHQPRIRRRGCAGMRKMKRAVQPETGGQHTCPLCWECFDTKTGLSNHARGHLKRAGRSVTSRKSPLCILNDLLQNKKEHRNILQVPTKSQISSRPSASQRFLCSNGLFLMHTCMPVKIQHPVLKSFVPKHRAAALSERKKLQVETERTSKASSSTLVELKTKRESVAPAGRNSQGADAPGMICDMTQDHVEQTETSSLEPVCADGVESFSPGECDSKKIYIRNDSTFPTVAQLPGHIQANAHRKRVIVHEEAGYDYGQKKPRQRPGLKKNTLPRLNAEICTLTCRFCDLVFQGPLSIQEDWIRHLQRHLLHTGVPHSGRGMQGNIIQGKERRTGNVSLWKLGRTTDS